jgi:DNA-binding response OmpR family regulator
VLRLRGRHILLLEDEPLISMMFKNDLDDAGATVIVASSCIEAMNAARAQRFDAATLDLRIGDGDCKTVADLLKEQGVPFIVTTGDVEGPDFGAAARLIKPCLSESLIHALLSVLPAPCEV